VQPDGKIVAVGTTQISGPNWHFIVARYNPDGSPDNTFGYLGKVLTDFGYGLDDGAYAVALGPNGRIVVAGTTGPFNVSGGRKGYVFSVAVYRSNGYRDTTFGQNGLQLITFASPNHEISVANSVAFQRDGKIVLAGYTTQGSVTNFALARLHGDGTLDNSFDGNGRLTTDFYGGRDEARGVMVQLDGKIVAAGTAQASGSNYNFALARYNSNGSLDRDFSGDGRFVNDYFGGDDGLQSVTRHPNGDIIAAGYTYVNDEAEYNFAVVRIRPLFGTLDGTFDIDGRQTVDVGQGRPDRAHAVVLQQDGKIVLGGYAPNGNIHNDFALVRLHTTGALDPSFGGDGLVTTEFEGGPDAVSGLAIQADGKIVAAGMAYRYAQNNYDIGLARYEQ
jgi:uncharacterized delta-60 repeat protein